MRRGAFEKGVHAPPELIFTIASFPFEIIGVAQLGDAEWQRRKHARAANLRGKLAAGGECEIADGFGLNPEPVLAMKQMVVRINLGKLGAVAGGLLIGGALGDEPNHGLSAPFKPDEFAGQPIEQGRVRGGIAAGAEVVHGTHEAFAKQMAPNVVGGNARHDGGLAINKPAG